VAMRAACDCVSPLEGLFGAPAGGWGVRGILGKRSDVCRKAGGGLPYGLLKTFVMWLSCGTTVSRVVFSCESLHWHSQWHTSKRRIAHVTFAIEHATKSPLNRSSIGCSLRCHRRPQRCRGLGRGQSVSRQLWAVTSRVLVPLYLL
jgi:hypothetical protein